MGARLRVAATGLALSVLAVLVLLVVRPGLNPAHVRPLPVIAAAWVTFGCAAALLRKAPLRAAVALVLLGGIAVQLAAVSAPPRNSDDLYRYVWDGRVQAAGIDPYEYVPAARQLTGLRTDFLWPGTGHCVSREYVSSHPAAELAPGCTRINRPAVPTIYPPVAEAYFLGVHYLPGGGESTTPIQAATALAAVLITGLLLFGLGRLGRDPRLAALWSWCPTVALEAGNSAHVDVIAVGIAAAALLALATARTTRRTVLGGVLLGLAVATKLIPALAAPAVLRRRWLTVSAAAGGAFVAVYVPHVIAVGGKVIGFMPGYLKQEGYDSGTRFGIIGLFAGGKAAIVAAVLVLAVAGLAVLRFADPDRPWRGAVVMSATALAVTTPHYQWYSLLLVMLVVLDGRPEWLAFAAGGYYAAEPDMGRLTIPGQYHDAVAYGVPVLIVAAGWLVRRELTRRRGVPAAAPAASPAPAGARAFLPVGYPCGKRQTGPAGRIVNEDMSYDSSRGRPPRQARWPHATPQEGWPAYAGGEGRRDGRGAAGADPGWGAAAADPGWPGRDGYTGAAGYPDGGTGWAYGPAGYLDQEYYAEPDPVSGPLLIAPDTVERDWLRDRGEQAAQGRGGLIAGALTGFLAAAVAIGVSTLAAAFVRPQASPVIAAGGAFIDRVPPGLKNLAVEHFGQHDTAILLTGMYVAIGLTAMVIGCLARRNVAAGVAGLAAFSLAGAFVVITRPGSRASDVIPPMIGGLAGIAALLWLARASAPAGPARHAHGGRRRRAR